MGTGSLPRVNRLWRGVDHAPASRAEVKGRVELYPYSPCGSSWPVLGWTLPLPVTLTSIYLFIYFIIYLFILLFIYFIIYLFISLYFLFIYLFYLFIYLFIYIYIYGLTAWLWLKFQPKYSVHIIVLYFNKCRIQWSNLYFILYFVSRFSSNYPILSPPPPLLCPSSPSIQTASIMIKINVPYEFRNKCKVRGLQFH